MSSPSGHEPSRELREAAHAAIIESARRRGWRGNDLEASSLKADADAVLAAVEPLAHARGAAERQEQIVAALAAWPPHLGGRCGSAAAEFIESLPVLPPSDLREAEPCATCGGRRLNYRVPSHSPEWMAPCPDCTGRADPRAQEGENDG